MNRIIILLFALLSFGVSSFAAENNPASVVGLLNRIGGNGTADRMVTVLDESLATNGQELFVITAINGKPAVKGTSISAITTGINWYLNHYAHVNLTWNQLTADLSETAFPVPENEERHVCDADYRYYLNYCTFGYSMTTWTWERWQQEIDWMALHGINMPLQIVGLEQVWKALLMEDYGYSEADAEAFVPGPAFTAWWGMNNLEGWGGDNNKPATGVKNDAWYDRQVALAQKILAREREMGMQPVLPGFSGTVPDNFGTKTGIACESQGGWCGFQRPYIMDPTNARFSEVAAAYYKQLEKVMGTSLYYSMDPFHEGGRIASGKYAEGYKAIYDAMNTCCGTNTKWVIQQWQWSSYQGTSLTAVPEKRLIVLDLFSDGQPRFDNWKGYAPQEAIYCAIPNFGGRTGFFGRIPKMADNYFSYKSKYASIKGIGAAPEAIEQTPVVYDLLFELPWMGQKPDCSAWMRDYAAARYGRTSVSKGTTDSAADTAWQILLNTVLNNTTELQGPHEAIVCARPSLTVNSVSTWGGTTIYYDQMQVCEAAYDLLAAYDDITTNGSELAKLNYSYDLVDITRQVLTDYSKSLLAGIQQASSDTASNEFRERRAAFLQLILDLDELLGTNRIFRLGNWTETARNAASEVPGATDSTRDWYELDNARTLITTWGDYDQSEGGLRDYSYREWQGMLKDYYYPRWKYWFEHKMQAPSKGWFYTDWNWAHETGRPTGATSKGTTAYSKNRTYYSAEPEGDSYEVAKRLLEKYVLPYKKSDGTTGYDYYLLDSHHDGVWTYPVEDTSDWSTLESYKQYINTLSAVVVPFYDGRTDEDAAMIYQTKGIPATLHQKTQEVLCDEGDKITLSWTGNDGLKYCYLTVWLDSDGDGTFEKKVTTLGTANAQNSAVCNGSVTITCPDLSECRETRVRMRFDSAWNIAKTADATATRFFYDIPLVSYSRVVGLDSPTCSSPAVGNAAYDLSGRRLAAAHHAVVISSNGRKTYIK